MNFCNKSQTPNKIPLIILSQKHAHCQHFLSLRFLLFNTYAYALVKTRFKKRRRRGQRERKKAIGLDWQNNNFARTSRFFVYFVAVAARRRETS